MGEEEQRLPVLNKKRGKHPQIDSDLGDLIYMWQQEECLCNTQNKDS